MYFRRSCARLWDLSGCLPRWVTERSPPSWLAALPWLDNTTGEVTFFNAEARETKGQWVYGVGATFDFTPQWHVRFDWDRTEAQDNINPKYDVDAYTLGIGYRF